MSLSAAIALWTERGKTEVIWWKRVGPRTARFKQGECYKFCNNRHGGYVIKPYLRLFDYWVPVVETPNGWVRRELSEVIDDFDPGTVLRWAEKSTQYFTHNAYYEVGTDGRVVDDNGKRLSPNVSPHWDIVRERTRRATPRKPTTSKNEEETTMKTEIKTNVTLVDGVDAEKLTLNSLVSHLRNQIAHDKELKELGLNVEEESKETQVLRQLIQKRVDAGERL